ncbi:hypothetical protein BH09BAC4_BH09BAC4_47970 [soil metagenome]
MKALYWLLCGLLASQPIRAQVDSTGAVHDNIVRRFHPEYDEEIMYYGKRNQYFSVKILRKNGSLLRLDSYTLLPKTLPNGFPLDSVNRIIRHGPTKIMYPGGQLHISCDYKDDFINGPFMVFYEDGAIKRKEFYRNGRVARSQCYTPEGDKQTCEPFYQAARFMGKPNELSDYLKQKLGSVLDGERIRKITATLRINEIGQVVNVDVSVNATTGNDQRVPSVVSYVQQIIRNMPEWTPEKMNWKPALNDGKAISSNCVLTLYRFYGGIQSNMYFKL